MEKNTIYIRIVYVKKFYFAVNFLWNFYENLRKDAKMSNRVEWIYDLIVKISRWFDGCDLRISFQRIVLET